jgi:hypothetical protein
MRRRRFFQALATLPAAAPLIGQQAPANQSAPGIPLNPTQGTQPPGRAAAEDLPKLEPSVPDAAADGLPRFLTPAQFATLRRLADILMPATATSPGALAAGAPEFLDFLIGDSGADRQQVYRAGLDSLNSQARTQFNKAFAEIEISQAGALLAPLQQPWTYADPADAVARFLRAAKADVRTATLNSRAAAAGRRFAGSGLYWYPLD